MSKILWMISTVLGWFGCEVTLIHVDTILLRRARILTREAEAHGQGTGYGEYRCHQVYARLIKEFPDTDRRVLKMHIELAL